jgi:hypothetical protein
MEAFMTRRSSILAALVACAVLSGACDDSSDQTRFGASLSGANEVPQRPTSASGSASFVLDEDTVFFTVGVQGINQVTMAHIHSGAAGTNGPVRVDLFLGPTTGAVNGTLAESTFTAANVRGVTFEALLEEMRTGNAYVNVHTTQFPSGEVRGQLQQQ